MAKKDTDKSPLSKNYMAHLLACASSALSHGRMRTACEKVTRVYLELMPGSVAIKAELKSRFPWLGTDEDAGSGADVIGVLAEWYAEPDDSLRAAFTGEMNNDLRAEWGARGVAAGNPDHDANDIESSVADTLANIMHFCKRDGIEFQARLSTAEMHFESEEQED